MKNIFTSMKLGFGLMRLPVTEERSIDLEKTFEMADRFIQNGYTYFDTAYVYHDGFSEKAVKEVLVNRYPRESFTVATKLPSWPLKSKDDVDRIFNEQLERTGLTFFDYYLLHCIVEEKSLFDELDCWNWAMKKKADGQIKHFGFSFHGTPETLDRILASHPEVEFVQLQINYLDWENDGVRSRECYEVARKYDLPIIVMEPVKGGTLAMLPEQIKDIFAQVNDCSPASWALKYCASLEGVSMILSGMSDLAQVEDNINTFNGFTPLNDSEKKCIDEATSALIKLSSVPCTACRYCTAGCPSSIAIPDLLACLNHSRIYGKNGFSVSAYKTHTSENAPASACIECGQCEDICPQHLSIMSLLKETAKVFEK